MTPYERAILDLVDAIPPGQVATYGDLAGRLGHRAARPVGAVLSRHGHEVAWHRVVTAAGVPAHPERSLALLRAEGCPLLADGRVDLARARWRPGS